MELTVLSISFAVLLVLGVPVAFSIGLASVATVLYAGMPVAIVFQKMVGGMQIFSFLAIPFFVFAGELMLYGGIADRIVRFANSLVGHVRGGLGMSNVMGCTLFGGVAGSPLADAPSFDRSRYLSTLMPITQFSTQDYCEFSRLRREARILP